MAIDRDALLRNAELLLRQGKLDQAIAEYRRVVDAQPRDWTTAIVLGDLYLRARQVDKAVETYARVAHTLGRDGFWSKASALYKKILKIRPQDEYLLLQAAEMAAHQELLVDAREYFNTVREQRRSRGDAAGVAAITIRLASLDPLDFEMRQAGIRAQIEIREVAEAVKGLKKLAGDLTEAGRLDQALAALRQAADLAPADVEIQNSIARISGIEPRVDSPRTEPASVVETVFVEETSLPPQPPPTSRDLEDVFADLREEATRRLAANNPDQELAAGLSFYRAGQLDFAVPRLEAASQAPAHRFEAAATLGRICLERGDAWKAIEWLERAAEAPAPTPAEIHRLLYELADALEGVGEVARALAICLELQAEAGDYQDVSARVDRLAKAQARG